MVGLRAVAARALAAVPELPMVSRRRTPEGLIRRPLLAVAIAAAVAVGVITSVVVMHPYLSLDATLQDDVQATNWGPLTLTFPFFTWLGGPGGIFMQVFVILAALAGGLSYLAIVNLVNRPRPTAGQILRVTEHPGSTSFPSGHIIFITISAAVLMLCLGHRYLPRWARPIGWVVVAVVVVAVGLDRIYAGTHWPSDVLAGLLIAIAWLSFVVSLRRVTDRALATGPQNADHRTSDAPSATRFNPDSLAS